MRYTSHAKQKVASDILETLIRKYPQHPGIAHYLIHTCDNAEMARQGVAAAKAYLQNAPAAPHALHMPSHIYTQTGMWGETGSSNLAGQKGWREESEKRREPHAVEYLGY